MRVALGQLAASHIVISLPGVQGNPWFQTTPSFSDSSTIAPYTPTFLMHAPRAMTACDAGENPRSLLRLPASLGKAGEA